MTQQQKRGMMVSAIGLLLLLAGGLTAADFRQRIIPTRFLVQPMNVLATPDESQILVGAAFSQLHLLDTDGRIERTWTLPTDGGAFRIALAGDDRVQVATQDTGLLLEYALDGELVTEREDAEAYARIGPNHEQGFTAPSGTQYLLDGGRLVRAGPDSEDVLIDGFESHAAITLYMIAMGVCLLLGVLLLIGGFVSTGRRGTGT